MIGSFAGLGYGARAKKQPTDGKSTLFHMKINYILNKYKNGLIWNA
jgi:hypothetical protein